MLLTLIISLSSCQEDEMTGNRIGYLRLQLDVNTSVNTKADYDPMQIAVQIINATGQVVKETPNWTDWEGESIALEPGKYTLNASSNGFDGQEMAFEKPYYVGSTEFIIEQGKSNNITVTCTLANVKVSVNFDNGFSKYFTEATVTVSPVNNGTDNQEESTGTTKGLVFEMGRPDKGSGYFPVTDLQAVLVATNLKGATITQTDNLESVQARDHHILNYSISGGDGEITITVDDRTHTYDYNVGVNPEPTTRLDSPSVNAWSHLAYMDALVSSSETLDDTKMKIQYRQKGTDTWTDITPTKGNTSNYLATITGLQANTTYECRTMYDNEKYTSEIGIFTTEEEIPLYNGNFDNWYQASGVWYAVAEDKYNGGNAFWDSGNKGASMMSKNPTTPEESIVHSENGKSAKLQSQFVGVGGFLGQFAAGNLYTGHFVKTIGMSGAEIQFGSEFTGRPTALHGWFQYTAGTVDYYGGSTPASALVQKGGTDMCAIYIALSDADQPYTVNTSEGNFVDYAKDPHIIAYGELPVEKCVTTSGWQEFTIDLEYRDLTRKPKYIIVVASASKYGDYFTGSTGSVMYIDDFELVYGEPSVEGQQ